LDHFFSTNHVITMFRQTRFVTLLGFLLMGGAMNAHAQLGSNVPQNTEGSRPATNNGNVNPGAGGMSSTDLMDSPEIPITMTAMPAKLTDFSTAPGKPSTARQFVLSGNVDNAALVAPQGFEISLQQATGYASSLKVGAPPVTIWVRLTGNKPNTAGTMIAGDINMSGSGGQTHASATAKISVEGVIK